MTTKTATLYELTDELLALDALLEETEGEVTPELEEWLEEYGAKTREKVDRICGYYRDLDARAKAKEAEAKELARKAGVDARKAESVKDLLELAMRRLGTRELQGTLYKAALQKHGGKRVLTLLAPIEAFPPHLVIQPPAPPPRVDVEALRTALDDGTPGVRVHVRDGVPLARLEPRGESVRIR